MRRTVGTTCLTIALALAVMMATGPSSRADAQEFEVKIKLKRPGGGDVTSIDLDDEKMRFAGLCKPGYSPSKKQCQGSQFKWRLIGPPLKAGERLVIKNAPYHLACFDPLKIPHTFDSANQNTPHLSGTATSACTNDKFGTYWPYVVEWYKNMTDKEPQVSTDPGGIIHP